MSKHPTPEHYQRRVGGVLLDPYRIARAYEMTDDALFSALKKVLAAGRRGAKDKAKDVQDAIDALMRWQEMEAEDNADSKVAALDAVDMRGPSAYCPGANGHTCDRGRLVECDEHGETDAGPCPRCNPPPPQTYRDRIAELEHKLAAQQMSYESQQIDHLARIAELERERDEAWEEIFAENKRHALTVQESNRWRQTAERAQSDLAVLRKTLETERAANVATAEELERYRTGYQHVLRSEGKASTAMLGELESRREMMQAIARELPSDVLQDDERTLAERVRDLRVSREQTAEELERVRREVTDERGWNDKRRDMYERLGRALDPFREKRYSGEPARDDATEVEAVCRELADLRSTLDAIDKIIGAELDWHDGEATETAVARFVAELVTLQDRYRPRRQSEEPAPDGAPIMRWNATTMRWQPSYGYELRPDHTWTHQPPAPGEGE